MAFSHGFQVIIGNRANVGNMFSVAKIKRLKDAKLFESNREVVGG